MNAVAYCRTSILDGSVYSLEYQEKAIRSYCEVNKLDLIEVFIDNGQSSYNFDRPDFQNLEKFVKKNKTVNFLIVNDLDRFSRNLADALTKIKELQDKYQIKVLTTSDRVDLDHTDPSNYLMRAFKLMMAEGELMNIRRRVKLGMMQAAKNGFWTTTAPYGYKNKRTEENKPTLEIHHENAKIVRQIFKYTAQGKSPVEIHKLLPEFKMKGKSAVRWMVENPVYIGMVKVGAYKDTPQYYTKGIHPPLVSEELFNLVQGKGTPKAINKKDGIPLRGVLKCWCGRELTAGNSKSKNKSYYWYYLCGEHRDNLSAIKLHAQLDEVLKNLTFSDHDVNYLRDQITYKIAAMLQTRGEDVGAAKKELNALKEKITNAEEKYLSNTDIDPETFKRIITELKTKQAKLKKRFAALTATSNDYMGQMEFMLPKLRDLSTAYNAMTLENKQHFLKTIFGESLNHADGVYRTPFLHPLFSHNALTLKEKKLLIIEQPVVKLGENSGSGPAKNRTWI